jgi:hypothetical protein
MCDLPDGSNKDHPTTQRTAQSEAATVDRVFRMKLSCERVVWWHQGNHDRASVNAALRFVFTGGRKSGSISSAHVGSPALNEYHSGAVQC